MRVPRLMCLLVVLVALAGCGNKGDLVLPADPAVPPAAAD